MRRMAGVDLVIAPTTLSLGPLGERTEGVPRRDAGAIDVAARQRSLTILQSQWHFETLNRLRRATLRYPFRVPFGGVGRGRIGRHSPTVARLRGLLHALPHRRRTQINNGLPVSRHKDVEIDQLRDPVARTIGHRGYDGTAVAVADQHDISQVLVPDDSQHILDVRLEIVLGACQVLPFTKARKGGCDQTVPGGIHQRMHFLPRPTRLPGAMRDKKCDMRLGLSHNRSPRLLRRAVAAEVRSAYSSLIIVGPNDLAPAIALAADARGKFSRRATNWVATLADPLAV